MADPVSFAVLKPPPPIKVQEPLIKLLKPPTIEVILDIQSIWLPEPAPIKWQPKLVSGSPVILFVAPPAITDF